MIHDILTAAIIGGGLYGLGMAALHAHLNVMFIRSFRTCVFLGLYFILLYPVLYLIPFTAIGCIISIFISHEAGIFMASVVAIALIFLALQAGFHLKFYGKHLVLYSRVLLGTLLSTSIVSALALIFWENGFVVIIATTSAILTVLLLSSSVFGRMADKDDEAIEIVDMPVPDKKRKLVWIGVDSATWDVMGPLLLKGQLPNISALTQSGSYGKLKSFVPTHSPIIWTTKATGKKPLKHGILGFIVLNITGLTEPLKVMSLDVLLNKAISLLSKFHLVRRKPISSLDRRAKAIWNILSLAGYRVGVVSWFVTDPVEKINGFMVPEFFYMLGKHTPISSIHPSSVEDDLKSIRASVQERFLSSAGDDEVIKRFRIRGELTGRDKRKIEVLKFFYFQDVLRKEVTEYLIKNVEVDVLIVYFHSVDALQHHFWAYQGKKESVFKDVIPSAYMFMDEVIGSLLERLPGDVTAFVTSDHGHGPCSPIKRLLNGLRGKWDINGDHSSAPDGIIIASGQGIRKGQKLEGVSVQDIVPTLLPVLNLPVGKDMDGVPVSQLYGEGVETVKYISSYEGLDSSGVGGAGDMTENQEVMERLKSLGYIE